MGPLRNVALSLIYCVLLLLLFGSHRALAAESAIQPPGTAASAGSSGTLNPKTGEIYPQVPGGALNPRTGQVYPEVPGGVMNPRTGEVYPRAGSGYLNPGPGRSPEVGPTPAPPTMQPLPSLPSSPQTPWGGGR